MEQIVEFLTRQLERAHPLLIPLIPVAMGVTKGVVSAVKVFVNRNKDWTDQLKGNIIQTLAGVVSLGVSAAQGASVGLFTSGLTASAVAGWLLLATIVWLGAIGVHELFQNTNPPEISPSPPRESDPSLGEPPDSLARS